MSSSGLERLDVWKKAKDFSLKVYREVLPVLPPEEKWGLNQQIRRAAASIPANIAEGYGRYYYQQTIHFCYIARGSLEETISHIMLAHDLRYVSDSIFEPIICQADDLVRLINGYIAYLKKTKQGESEPGSKYSVQEESAGYEIVSASDEQFQTD